MIHTFKTKGSVYKSPNVNTISVNSTLNDDLLAVKVSKEFESTTIVLTTSDAVAFATQLLQSVAIAKGQEL